MFRNHCAQYLDIVRPLGLDLDWQVNLFGFGQGCRRDSFKLFIELKPIDGVIANRRIDARQMPPAIERPNHL